jgi:polyisoprenoid-binding protein YceI
MPISTSTPTPPPAGRYVIDASDSTITFVTKHMFGLAKVRGRFTLTRGSVVVGERAEDSSVEAEISASSFSTRNPMRDMPVRSPLFLGAHRHPAISFRANDVQRRGDTWAVIGTITVKGKSGPVELTLKSIERDGASTVFTAQGTVDRYEHGITTLRGMAARHLSFDITAHTTKA